MCGVQLVESYEIQVPLIWVVGSHLAHFETQEGVAWRKCQQRTAEGGNTRTILISRVNTCDNAICGLSSGDWVRGHTSCNRNEY